MKRYQQSSELQRSAEEAVRNEERLRVWRKRWARHTNSNVVKFPARRRQYMHTRLPEPPEVA